MTSDLRISFRTLLDFSPKQQLCADLLKDSQHTEILYGGGAGGGKSFLGCAWLIRNCLKYAGTRWLMGRSELKTLKATTLKTFFEVASILLLVADVDYIYKQQQGEIIFSNGSEIVLKDLKYYPTDPNFDALGSLEITGAFIDECNQITEKARDVVKSRIRYKLDENGLVPKLLMTCNPAKNWTYQQYYKPSREKDSQSATGTLLPYRAFVQALVGDNPKISRHYKTNLDGLPKVLRMRLRDGVWEMDDDAATLIQYDKIVDLFSNSYVPTGKMYLTCDAARFGKDNAKIYIWSGWRLVRVVTFPRSSMVTLADEIESLMAAYHIPASNVVIDEDGVGGGCIDILRQTKNKQVHGFVNNSAALEEPTTAGKTKPNYANLKAQCSYRMADRINAGGYYVEPDVMNSQEQEYLIQEMEQVKIRNVEKDTKLDVVPKDQVKELIGRSPDSSDTFMFREYFELTYKPPTTPSTASRPVGRKSMFTA